MQAARHAATLTPTQPTPNSPTHQRHERRRERDDIPVMLIDEAVTVDDAEHARLMGRAQAESIPSTLEGGGA